MAKVKVEEGWLEGEVLELVTGDGQYYSFKGIPYAEPPLGNLRFKAPLPAKPWDGIRKATEHGPVCYQKEIFSGEIIPGAEDCLYLNVYTPDLNPKSPLAVMIFIHGGGYVSGSGNDDVYGPDFLLQHNVVIVTINYRLDALGFLCLDTAEVPGNAGMKDQVAALKWVQRNIANFGGDPNNVTIFGESAGGASVSLLVISPMSKGLFKRAIPMSGVPTCDWSLSYEPRRRAFALGKELGLQTEDPQELLRFLQKVPVEDLIDKDACIFASEIVIRNLMKMYHFVPVVEKDFGQERFLSKPPLEALNEKCFNEVDVLIGYTDLEAIILIPQFESSLIKSYSRYDENLVPRKILYECLPSKTLKISDIIRKHYFGGKPITVENMKKFVKYASESCFTYQVHNFLFCLAKNSKSDLYLYNFACVSERNLFGKIGAKYGLTGASHLDDLMYLFNSNKFYVPVNKSLPSYRMIQQTCTLFTNFAKYGNPTPEAVDGVTWPLYDNETQAYMKIGEKLVPGRALNADVVDFWKKIYEIAGVPL